MALSNILWLFGKLFLFWYLVPRNIWQPWSRGGWGRLVSRSLKVEGNLVAGVVVDYAATQEYVFKTDAFAHQVQWRPRSELNDSHRSKM
jgi:hypothetical protein